MASENIQELSNDTKKLIETLQTMKGFHEKSRNKKAEIKAKREHNQKLINECISQAKKLKVSSPDELLELIKNRFEEAKKRVDAYGEQLRSEHEAYQTLARELKDLEQDS
jgi:hypothetical protein